MRNGEPEKYLDFVRSVALKIPFVEESTAYGNPAFRVKGKFMGSMREDGDTLSIKVEKFERDLMIQSEPDKYFITDHYLNYDYVVVRLENVTEDDLYYLFKQAWRLVAPKRLLKEHGASL